MPWNGAGSFVRTDGTRTGSDVAQQQKAAGVKVRADLHDIEMEDIATGLENTVARDGQNAASANLPMGGFKHTGVTASSGGSSRTEYTSGGVVQDGAILDAGDTGGTATAFTAVLSPAITAYANKQLFRVKFNAAFGATPTINFNSVGAKKMYAMVGSTATQLTTNNVPQNYVALLRYDTALDSAAGAFLLLNPPLDLTILPAETTLATDDLLVISDTSEDGAANKMTVENALKVVNALTADTAPDGVADLLLTYDASASGPKKATLLNLLKGASLLATLTASSSAALDFIPTNQALYSAFLFVFERIYPATDGADLGMRVSTDGGSSFVATTAYVHAYYIIDSSPAAVDGSGTQLTLINNTDNSAGSNTAFGGTVLVINEQGANGQKHLWLLNGYVGAANHVTVVGGGHANTAAVNGYRIRYSTGNITSGIVRVYGFPK